MSSAGGYALAFFTTLCGLASGVAAYFLCKSECMGWGWFLIVAAALVAEGSVQGAYTHAVARDRGTC